MPLDRPRRIFCHSSRSLHSGRSFRRSALYLLLFGTAALGGVTALRLAPKLRLALPADDAPHLVAAAPQAGRLSADPEQVAVIDGDTLRLRDTVVHLKGVAAPERGETCRNDGTDCGNAAAAALARLVRERRVECDLDGTAPGGRAAGICRAGGIRINAAVVESGWALARPRMPELVRAEQEARAGRRGLWAPVIIR